MRVPAKVPLRVGSMPAKARSRSALLREVAHPLPAFQQYFVGAVEHLFHHRPSRAMVGQDLHHRLKPQHQSLKSL